jgi:aspartate-semialdehyde dehydrogenase
MDRQFRVAVVGATGLVGEAMITVLEERGFPVSQLHALASNRSVGRSVSFRGRSYPVQELADFDFAHCDFALFSAGAQVSREYAPRAVAGRLHRHRQHLRVPLSGGRAAGGTGGEP